MVYLGWVSFRPQWHAQVRDSYGTVQSKINRRRCLLPFREQCRPRAILPTLICPSRRPDRRYIDTFQNLISHFATSSTQAVNGSPSIPAACVSTRPMAACATQLEVDDEGHVRSFFLCYFPSFWTATLPLSWVSKQFFPILHLSLKLEYNLYCRSLRLATTSRATLYALVRSPPSSRAASVVKERVFFFGCNSSSRSKTKSNATCFFFKLLEQIRLSRAK